jgi:acyl-CoA reductase-like NAD-dependent aldehyde dehydrogenase
MRIRASKAPDHPEDTACVCPNRFLVQSGIYDEFASRLSQRNRRGLLMSATTTFGNKSP